MFRSVVKDDTAQEFFRRFDAENLFETLAKVGVEIVHHQVDTARFGIDLLKQMLDECNEVGFGAAVGDQDRSPATFGLDSHEQIAGARAHIFVIVTNGYSRAGWQRRTRILEQLLALFIETNDGFAIVTEH